MGANSQDSFGTTHNNSIKKVAVFGGTGQVGTPMAHTLLEQGHQVVAISRGRSAHNESRLADLEKCGAKLAYCEDLRHVDNELTLRASELYPDYACIKPVDVLKDPNFIFDTD